MGKTVKVWDKSDRFVVFADKTYLTLHKDLSSETPNTVTLNLLDSLNNSADEALKEALAKLEPGSGVTSLSVDRLDSLDLVFNDKVKGELKDLGESHYLVTASLPSELFVLFLYNYLDDKFKLLAWHKLNLEDDPAVDLSSQEEEQSDVSEVGTLPFGSVYSLFKFEGFLQLINWNTLKTTKLFEAVLTYKLDGDRLFVFYQDKLEVHSLNKEATGNEGQESKLFVFKESLVLEGVSFDDVETVRDLATVLPEKNLAFLVLGDGVFYTFLDKLKLYKFVSNPVTGNSQPDSDSTRGKNYHYLQGRVVNDLAVLVTMNKYLVQLWDYDTQNVLYQCRNRGFDVCLLNVVDAKNANLMGFQNSKLVENTKLVMSDEGFTPVDAPKDSEVKNGPTDENAPEQEDEQTKKRKLEEQRYKKLKRIKKNKFVDNEAGEYDEEEEEEEAEEDEDEVASEKRGDDYSQELDHYMDEDPYRGRDVVSSQDERYLGNEPLKEELEKLQKRLKSLEKRLVRRTPRVIMPGTCPMPNDKLKQWCLFWNEYGHISKQTNMENNNLHIYLFSGPLSGYIKKPDRYSCHVASLCVNGIICGSNLNNNNNTIGIIYYLNLATNESWERRFKNESVSCVVISDNFIAAVTDLNILYIFTRNNLLLSVFKLKGKVRSLMANKNILAVITEIANSEGVTLSIRLLWINGIRGLSKNNAMKIISIYDDLLTLDEGVDLRYVGLTSDFILWYIDTKGYLWLLVNSMSNLSGLGMMEWLPTINISDINKNIFPLYIDNLQLCYVKLKGTEQYPDCNKNTNFFGYTLSRLNLRVDNLTNYYFNYTQYQSILKSNPTLKEYVANLGDGEAGESESTLNIPWQQYDDMRYIQNINIHHLEYIVKLIRLNNFWFSGGGNDNSLNNYINSIRVCEKNHDKWLLRILRKIQLSKELYINGDIIQMLKMPRCLEIAKTIIKDVKYNKLINDSLVLLQKTSQLMTT